MLSKIISVIAILLSTFCITSLEAQQQKKNDPKPHFDVKDYGQTIMKMVDSLEAYTKEKEPDLSVSKGIIMRSLGDTFSEASKHPKIEEATEIYAKWFKKLGECTKKLGEIRTLMELAKEKNEKEQLEKCQKEYANGIKILTAVLEKPERIPKTELQKRQK